MPSQDETEKLIAEIVDVFLHRLKQERKEMGLILKELDSPDYRDGLAHRNPSLSKQAEGLTLDEYKERLHDKAVARAMVYAFLKAYRYLKHNPKILEQE
ncbi:MAG: hypothetical protein JW967_09195 [Dehalococcoidales bacterium]|nr:hypothetical protein [Dehalococcoidales bacterium]